MAHAYFHSNRGEKSALIGIKANPFVYGWSHHVYIPRTALPADIAEGDTFEIPDGFEVVDMVDPETGEVRTTKEGDSLKVLAY